jgi:hypothetical protein
LIYRQVDVDVAEEDAMNVGVAPEVPGLLLNIYDQSCYTDA